MYVTETFSGMVYYTSSFYYIDFQENAYKCFPLMNYYVFIIMMDKLWSYELMNSYSTSIKVEATFIIFWRSLKQLFLQIKYIFLVSGSSASSNDDEPVVSAAAAVSDNSHTARTKMIHQIMVENAAMVGHILFLHFNGRAV